jgi:hypothetical protein
MITGQRRLLLLGVCVLLLAFVIPFFFPQWDVYTAQLLQRYWLFIGALLFNLLFLLLWQYPQRQVALVRDKKDRIDLESKSRQTLVQLVGGAALLGGLYFTAQTLRTSQETLRVNQKTLETTQQGQITERFTKAIEQLGSDKRALRLGGLYALERIARDSEADHWPVMEVLTALVREQAPAKTMPPDKTSGERETKESPHEWKPSPDIQPILAVIGRRTRTFGKGETQPLDLSNTHLRGAHLEGTQLQNANLQGTQLQNANLIKAQLQNANLEGTQLQGANLVGAQLQSAYLVKAQLHGANLAGAQLQGANLTGAELQSANLSKAQLQGVNLGS